MARESIPNTKFLYRRADDDRGESTLALPPMGGSPYTIRVGPVPRRHPDLRRPLSPAEHAAVDYRPNAGDGGSNCLSAEASTHLVRSALVLRRRRFRGFIHWT